MYIKNVWLENIKGIKELHLGFEEGREPGWHVILGDNGSGKTSLIRAIALAIIGPDDFKALRLNLREWIRIGATRSKVVLEMIRDSDFDKAAGTGRGKKRSPLWADVIIRAEEGMGAIGKESFAVESGTEDAYSYVWNNKGGWFSAGFGPFRRFTGGDPDVTRIYYSVPKAGAHVSLFGENVAFMEALNWLRELHNARQSGKNFEGTLLSLFTDFVNRSRLLAHSTQIKEINNEGVFFEDGNKVEVHVSTLSDGFRSMLSLMFELLRQLLRVYEVEEVFTNANKELFTIDVPGVVLIDEVDAHLHPTWQTRIGEWFTTYFPNIQFIVTTHSPLICRGAIKGSIFKLSAPGSEEKSGPVSDLHYKQLVYGDILDAYGTSEFGEVAGSPNGAELRMRLQYLKRRSMDGDITEDESMELRELRSYL